jgi:hypothetical protein
MLSIPANCYSGIETISFLAIGSGTGTKISALFPLLDPFDVVPCLITWGDKPNSASSFFNLIDIAVRSDEGIATVDV